MPVTSPSRGGMQSCGGVSLGGQSCLAEEIGSPHTPSISAGAVSRLQRPLPRRQRANHVDVDSGLEGEPHGVTDLVGKKSMANTTQPTTTGTGPSDIPFSGIVEVPSEEHPLGEQSAQPAPVALATMASACLVISLLTLLWRPAAPAHRRRRSVCRTRACVALNDMLVAASNASVDPCDNFYERVCGGWRESASVYENHLSHFVDKQERRAHRIAAARVFEAFRISPLLSIRKSRTKAGEVFLRIEPGDALPNWVKMRALLVKEGNYRSYYERVADLYNSDATPTISFPEFNQIESVQISVFMCADRGDAEMVELDSMDQLSRHIEHNSFMQLRAFLK
ncbi:hypothetical protein HPB49_014217 [Dermacentor silvarum]|uniref:Uncharacterized protein n=1 Tax=Dermacentor silvarum TaxID=543639 RepID=A0ACB8DIY8_DERSI|nr:hypothetical protein HPB49_014217 [Dermacentor silvarum]